MAPGRRNYTLISSHTLGSKRKKKKRFFFSVLTLRDDEREEKTYV
jgi:hypothetical protein